MISSLYVFLFLSGFAGLGYEMAWTRMLAVGLGHEIVSVLAVVAAFFAGVAVGAWGLDRHIRRSRRPGFWYSALEATIGLWSIALIVLIPWANTAAATLIGVEPTAVRQWGVAFALPFLLLLPATAAMGATLPAMERVVYCMRRGGKAVGGLYAVNTFGAVAGTMISTLWLAPTWGFTVTLAILAAINGICAIGTLWVTTRSKDTPAIALEKLSSPARPIDTDVRRYLLILLVTGFLGIGYEVLIVRMLSQILENTIYSFAAVLAVYLLGTALGGAAYQRFRPRDNFKERLADLLILLSVSCLAGAVLLWVAKPSYEEMRAVTSLDLSGGISAELVVAALVLILPTMAMGATFSHLAQRITDSHDRLGDAVAINTLGAAAAPLAFGVGLLPAIGSKAALLIASTGYLLLVPWTGKRRLAAMAAVTVGAAAVFFVPADFRFVEVPPGGSILDHEEGVMAAVSVVTDQRDVRYLKVNDEFRMGSTASSYSDRRQAHVPLLLHPDPHSALFLGLGTGATLAGVLDYPDLTADGVELVPEIVGVMPYFDSVLDGMRDNDRVHIIVADARRYVRATPKQYDVIIADVFHPSRDGAGSLYTAEHFSAVRDRLAPGGLFCQWLPLYQLDLDTLKTIVRTFLTVFPDASAYVAHYSLLTPMLCLVGTAEPRRYPLDWFKTRVSDPHLETTLARLDLNSTYALLGNFVAGPADLARLAGPGPINTDDHPVVTFSAPRAVYGGLSPTWGRLKSVIEASKPDPAEVVSDPDGINFGFARRLAAYWRARDAFLATGTTVEPSADPRVMARQVSKPLLAIVRISPDFDPAYRPLLALARDLARVDPAGAGQLLIELDHANPTRDDARHLYAQLFPSGTTSGSMTEAAPTTKDSTPEKVDP